MVLLSAFGLKAIDEYFYVKLQESHLFAIGVFIDLVIGLLMLCVQIPMYAALMGITVFSAYFIFTATFNASTCDCFGKLSASLGSIAHLVLLAVCVFSCLFVIVTSRKISVKQQRRPILTLLMCVLSTGLGLVAVLLFARGIAGGPELMGTVKRSPTVNPGVERSIVGLLSVLNNSQERITILGCPVSVCQGGVRLDRPHAIEPGETATFEGEFIPSNISLFYSGVVTLVVANHASPRKYELRWIVVGE